MPSTTPSPVAPPDLPVRSGLDRSETQRSVRHLHFGMTQVERALSDRSFRLWLLITLNALDLLTTAAVLALGGVEANPAMAPFVESWWQPIAVKASVLGLMWAVVVRTPPRSRISALVLSAAWIFYAGVVGWNTLLLITY